MEIAPIDKDIKNNKTNENIIKVKYQFNDIDNEEYLIEDNVLLSIKENGTYFKKHELIKYFEDYLSERLLIYNDRFLVPIYYEDKDVIIKTENYYCNDESKFANNELLDDNYLLEIDKRSGCLILKDKNNNIFLLS